MTPQEIVSELDRHIVGQHDAKRAVAIALRNRWRRQQVDEAMRGEITPKNILMIGPTGVGKTEIARRLARLADAPFVKVEATKFTEVGYVGKDVDSIVRDLVDIGGQAGARARRCGASARSAEDARRGADPRGARAARARSEFGLAPLAAADNTARPGDAQAPARAARSTTARSRSRSPRRSRRMRSWGRPAWRRWPSSCAACSRSLGRHEDASRAR